MPQKKIPYAEESLEKPFGMTAIGVGGFKSIREHQAVDIRPLTILAGANSSGKSSLMQPLLLMKQTLEAPFDPGTFLLDGPNVKFTSADQLFSKHRDTMRAELHVGSRYRLATTYNKTQDLPGIGVSLESLDIPPGENYISIRSDMNDKDLISELGLTEKQKKLLKLPEFPIRKNRCFLGIKGTEFDFLKAETLSEAQMALAVLPAVTFMTFNNLKRLMHLPGLRGNPEREYPRTGVGPTFPGTFGPYVASIVHKWQELKDEQLELLGLALEHLGLTWKVEALPVKDAHVELHVPRTRKRSKTFRRDMVNIADVGLGVSQALPVLVALLSAEPAQMVYIEQPEIHLHPRAQVAMARILADAAKRGVRVVAETHSSLLLLGIQTLVAEGYLAPDLVKLHWFQLDKEGFTKITSSDLDEAGRFDTDWPEDFGAVELQAQSRYLDESEKRIAGS